MLELTVAAKKKIVEAINSYKQPVFGVRALANARSPFQVHHQLEFVTEENKNSTDISINLKDFDVFIGKKDKDHFEKAKLDFMDGNAGNGFRFLNIPRVPEEYKGTLAEKVVEVIDEQINPGIAGHGGFVSLLDIKDTEIFIQMGGGCQGCGMANVTLKQVVEKKIKEVLPEITAVYDTTDHADGNNPYYNE